MADFPRIKWLNIDGQQVPFTEPQHFTGNGDETVRTGKDNPLPVANYTQNDNGIWLPVSKDNPMPTQVTGSNVEYVSDRVDEEIEPGVTYILTDNLALKGAKTVSIGFVCDSNRKPFRISIRGNTHENGGFNERVYDRHFDDYHQGDSQGYFYWTEPIFVLGNYLEISLLNESDSTVELRRFMVRGYY